MLIIAGTLTVDPSHRAAYLDAVANVAVLARAFAGCLAFVQAADPIEASAIVIYERWESDEALHAFRTETPPIVGASVSKYRIDAIERLSPLQLGVIVRRKISRRGCRSGDASIVARIHTPQGDTR